MRGIGQVSTIGIMLLAIAVGSGAASDDQWLEVQSSHFEVLTDGTRKQGRDLAEQFEQLHSVFAELLPGPGTKQAAPLQIIALKTSKEISQYSRLYQGKPVRSAGFCLRSEDRDYIVLDLSTVNRENVTHEYAHVILDHEATDLPVWFSEGFAQLYSTIEIDGQHARVGRRPQSAAEALRTQKLIPVLVLFSVTSDSSVYNQDSDPRSIFYAQSWLVAHYLWEHNEMEGVRAYLHLIHDQMPVAEAFRQSFHVDPAQFDVLLKDYSTSGWSAVRTTARHQIEQTSMSVKPISVLEAKTLLADLHSHQPDYQDQAIGELENILRQDPDNAVANRDLGYIYDQKQDYDGALPHLQKALEQSPNDWQSHFLYAEVSALKQDDRLAPQIEKDARRVTELNPEFADAYNLLGFALMVERRNPEAEMAYQQALARKPGTETFELNLAELYVLENRQAEAKTLFLRLQGSKNPAVATAARSHLEVMTSREESQP